jgi:hypothetical protein
LAGEIRVSVARLRFSGKSRQQVLLRARSFNPRHGLQSSFSDHFLNVMIAQRTLLLRIDVVVLLSPPAFSDVILFFRLSQFFELVGRIPQDAVKDPAAIVFAVRLAAVGQMDHFFRQLQRFDDMKVAGPHGVSLRHGDVMGATVAKSSFMPEKNRSGGCL